MVSDYLYETGTMRYTVDAIPAGATVAIVARATGGSAKTIVKYHGYTYRVDAVAVA